MVVTTPCTACLQHLHDRCVGSCPCEHPDPISMAARMLEGAAVYVSGAVTAPVFDDLLEAFHRIADALPMDVDLPKPRAVDSGAR